MVLQSTDPVHATTRYWPSSRCYAVLTVCMVWYQSADMPYKPKSMYPTSRTIAFCTVSCTVQTAVARRGTKRDCVGRERFVLRRTIPDIVITCC
eukprot:490415-Rhodomonas_salina.1